MINVLGLDVSTSCVGVCIIDENFVTSHMGHVTFKGCNTLWEKADKMFEEFDALCKRGITSVFIEESLQSFRPGFSSANTIVSLAKFNGLVSYAARQKFCCEPRYIASSTARKACGVKFVKGLSKNHKLQTFEHITSTDLKEVVWPRKLRSENIVDWAYDEVDAYVIAKAGMLLMLKGV